MARLPSVFTRSFIKGLGVAGAVALAGWLIKLMIPSLDVNQISVGLAALVFYWEYTTEKAEKSRLDIEEKIKIISDNTDRIERLESALANHIDDYGHTGIAEDLRKLQQRESINSARIEVLQDGVRNLACIRD